MGFNFFVQLLAWFFDVPRAAVFTIYEFFLFLGGA